ncbi:hypothetical protein HZ326_8208 [Fusarium oxysporum f. sp. albedinis]|nr:hypothetical protein HZ326_8208 [Fusarium oxysporum f. sp. albedinis]
MGFDVSQSVTHCDYCSSSLSYVWVICCVPVLAFCSSLWIWTEKCAWGSRKKNKGAALVSTFPRFGMKEQPFRDSNIHYLIR